MARPFVESRIDSGEGSASASRKRRWTGEIFPYVAVCLLLWFLIGGLYVLGSSTSDSEHIFLGFLGSGHHQWVIDDGSVYLDLMEQARDGEWLLSNRFSPEMGPRRYLNSIWVVLGKLSALSGASPLGVYTVFRFAAILLFVLALRGALREFVQNQAARPLTLVLIVFGGGLGWIFGVISQWYDPVHWFFIESKKSEVWCFLATMIGPHNVLAMTLVIWIMTGFAVSSRGVGRALLVLPACAFLLATFHPYDLPLIYAVGAVFLIIMRLRDGKTNSTMLGAYAGVVVVSMPVLAYHYWSLSTAPDLRGLFQQNDIMPYSTIRYVIGLLPLGLLAFRQLTTGLSDFRNADNGRLLILSWLAALPLLLYSYPDVSFAWKFTIGMPLPLCILAVEWMERRAKQARESAGSGRAPLWRATPAIAGIVVVSLLSSAYIALAMARTALEKKQPYYISRAEYDALIWLGTQPGYEDSVLSSRQLGRLVPRFARKRAFAGHDHQSVDFVGKIEFAESLYDDGALTEDELQVLRKHRVRWLLYGPEERKWWPDPGPSRFTSLKYDKDGIRIYRMEVNSRHAYSRLPR